MTSACQCCSLRPRSNEKYCSFCINEHIVVLRSVARRLTQNVNQLPLPNASGLLAAAIVLRDLQGDEGEARDLLLRQMQALEAELEVCQERTQDLAKDYVDMQSYARFLEKKYDHTLDVNAYKKGPQSTTLEDSQGDTKVVDERTASGDS